jgi:hypothetical protein
VKWEIPDGQGIRMKREIPGRQMGYGQIMPDSQKIQYIDLESESIVE